jgi:hypothetical protein
MKKLIALLLITVAAAFGAHAQYNIDATSFTGAAITNCAATTTNTISSPVTIPVTRANNAGLGTSFKLGGSGTSAVVLKYDASVDNVAWETAAFSQTITANGTNTVYSVDNIATVGYGFIRLSSIENPNASLITELKIMVGQKPGL